MDAEEIRRTIAAFPRWHYQFDLRGQTTPIWRDDQANRHRQRLRYIMDPVLAWSGGSLAGRRVLDLGCNAGFWALHAVEAGCREVVGVDGRQMHVEQADFVFRVNEVPRERYRFVCADVFDPAVAALGTFDVVLCLGLLYHVNRPVELFDVIATAAPELVVVDTALSTAPGPYLEMRYESTDLHRNAIDDPMVLYPTALAVAQLLRHAGYAARMLRPRFTDVTGCWDYQHGRRRAFLGTRGSDDLDLPFEVEEIAATRPGRPP